MAAGRAGLGQRSRTPRATPRPWPRVGQRVRPRPRWPVGGGASWREVGPSAPRASMPAARVRRGHAGSRSRRRPRRRRADLDGSTNWPSPGDPGRAASRPRSARPHGCRPGSADPSRAHRGAGLGGRHARQPPRGAAGWCRLASHSRPGRGRRSGTGRRAGRQRRRRGRAAPRPLSVRRGLGSGRLGAAPSSARIAPAWARSGRAGRRRARRPRVMPARAVGPGHHQHLVGVPQVAVGLPQRVGEVAAAHLGVDHGHERHRLARRSHSRGSA